MKQGKPPTPEGYYTATNGPRSTPAPATVSKNSPAFAQGAYSTLFKPKKELVYVNPKGTRGGRSIS